MTEVAELVNVPINKIAKNQCPFCKEAKHAFPTKKKDPNVDAIVSNPAGLECKGLRGGKGPGNFRYTTASHHMIPAIQCFKQVRRLAAMALSVGYDINHKPNGIPLPTVRNPYTSDAGSSKSFGKLEPSEKVAIREDIMRRLGKQWHVGNHHYEIPTEETEDDETEGMADEGSIDHQPYDVVVVRRLLDILVILVDLKPCKKDKQDKVKSELKELEDEIRKALDAFTDPRASDPYYVSLAARQFSG